MATGVGVLVGEELLVAVSMPVAVVISRGGKRSLQSLAPVTFEPRLMLPHKLTRKFGQFGARFGPVLARFRAPFGPAKAARSEQFSRPTATHAC